MELKISVLKTNTTTNETVVKDFFISKEEWESIDVDIVAVEGKHAQRMNEPFNTFIFLCDGFGEKLELSDDLDFDDDVENIFPFYRLTDIKKRKKGYIYDFHEKDGIKMRIILIAPKHFLPSLL
jgi:hypothetical protein